MVHCRVVPYEVMCYIFIGYLAVRKQTMNVMAIFLKNQIAYRQNT